MGAETKTPSRVYRRIVEDILEAYVGERWPLIPVLQEIQRRIGYVPPECVDLISDALRLFPSEIQGVISFYGELRDKPRGRTIVRVCSGTACHICGGSSVLEAVKETLGIEDGESTRDLRFALETVPCVGACGLAPNVVIDDKVYGGMTADRIRQLLRERGAD